MLLDNRLPDRYILLLASSRGRLTTSFRIIVNALAPGSQSSSTILGNRFSCIHVHASDPLISSAVRLASNPSLAARPIASLAPRIWIPAST